MVKGIFERHHKVSVISVIVLIVFAVVAIASLLFAPLIPTFTEEIVDDNRNYYFQLLDSKFADSCYATHIEKDSAGNESYVVEVDSNTYMVYKVYLHNNKEVFDFYYYGVYEKKTFEDPRDTILYEPAVMLLDSIGKTHFTDSKVRGLTVTADPVDKSNTHYRRVASTKSAIWTYDAVKNKNTGFYDISVHIFDTSISRNADYKSVVQMIPSLHKFKKEESKNLVKTIDI